jgi:hypothetical protein
MFTDIYVSIQSSQVLQERWHEETTSARAARWPARLLRTLNRK